MSTPKRNSLVIRNGRLLDPKNSIDVVGTLLVTDGRVKAVADEEAIHTALKDVDAANLETIDADGLWVTPGLIDMHVHLREPGEEYKEDLQSGTDAAAAGGFTTIVAMPNTKPVVDSAPAVDYVIRRSEEISSTRVLPCGAVSIGQKGKTLAPYGEMKRAGAVALSDDGIPVMDPQLMRSALEYSLDFDIPVLTHAEDLCLTGEGCMHEGVISERLGLHGTPRISEDTMVMRDILLAEYTGARLHICHVSTKGAVEAIRQAKLRGVRVSGEAAPHHFSLTHEAVADYDTHAKMSPPLREEEDRQAVALALKDGTLQCIATDHAPHTTLEKDIPFSAAANGIIGLQTSVPLSLRLMHMPGVDMTAMQVIERMTWGPAQILGLASGHLGIGAVADISLIDPNHMWVLDAQSNHSKSKNSPFWGKPLKGCAVRTIVAGHTVYDFQHHKKKL